MTQAKRDRIVRKIEEAQTKAGLRCRTNDASAGTASPPEDVREQERQTISSWLSDGAGKLWNRVNDCLPALPSLLPGAQAASNSANQVVKSGDVLIVRREGKDQNAFGDNAREGLAALYPAENIHEVAVDQSCQYPYPRNLIKAGPDGMLLTGALDPRERDAERIECLRQALKSFLTANELAYQELGRFINFANVAWYPDKDLLIVANADDASLKLLAQEVYDRPGRVIYAPTIAHRDPGLVVRDSLGRNACYDLDMGFFSIAVPDAEHPGQEKRIALVHEPCFWNGVELLDSDLKPITARTTATFTETLTALGFQVIPLSKQDMLRLGANAIASTQEPGTALMSEPSLSKYLLRKLRQAGVDVRVPEKTLGNLGSSDYIAFGIHCLTAEIYRGQQNNDGATAVLTPPEKDEF